MEDSDDKGLTPNNEDNKPADIMNLIEINLAKIVTRKRKHKKCYLYPDDNFRVFWDLITTL